MSIFASLESSWGLLGKPEKKQAINLVFVVIFAALMNAAMIGSIWPFLNLVGDPSVVYENKYYSFVYSYLSFESPGDFIVFTALASFFTILLSTVAQVYRVYAVSNFALMRSHTLSYKLFKHYLGLSYEFHTLHESSRLEANALSETQQVVMQLFRPAANIVAALTSIFVTLLLLLIIDPLVTGSVLLVFGIFYGAVLFSTRTAVSSLGKKRQLENQKCFQIASEALNGIKEIKVNRIEKGYMDRFFNATHVMARSTVIAQFLGESPNFVLQGLTFGGMIVLTLVLLDVDDVNTASQLGETLPLIGIFAFAGQRLIPELQRVFQGITQLQYAKAAAQNLEQELEVDQRFVTRSVTPEPLQGSPRQILLQNVSYKFPGSESYAVKNINLKIEAGTKVGIVGTTGSGKTTLFDIFLGLMRPTDGRILLDGAELTDRNMDSWQDSCSYVPQDVYLFEGTIKGNIVFTRNGSFDVERCEWAVRSAMLEGFINSRDGGIESKVGERGVRLSGGQRQRIGIARALYRKTDFLFLDEATSALDNTTERALLASLNTEAADMTLFLIAHRLSSVMSCDQIIVMNDGELVGVGDWESLMRENSYFRDLVKSKEQ